MEQARSLDRDKQGRVWRKRVQAERKQNPSKAKKGSGSSEKQRQSSSTDSIKAKLYPTFSYQAESWTSPHRILWKAEVSEAGANLRLVVTNLEMPRNAWIYETIYCGRGQMERSIKDHKRLLHADRTSCHKCEATQFRFLLHSAADVLLHTFTSKGLRGTAWSRAPCDQIQLRLWKVGARIEE